MSLAQGNNTPTRPRIEPGSPDPESDALTTRPVRFPIQIVACSALSLSKVDKWTEIGHIYVLPKQELCQLN